MIHHPGALALLAGSLACLGLLLLALPRALTILRRWDREATTEVQFGLEKATYLISALAAWAFGVNLLSFYLYIATADDFSTVLAGAMCATGALNANPVGWWVLLVKALFLLTGGVWLVVNSVDNSRPDWPLLKFKYALLIGLTPLALLDLGLLWAYLSGLSPDVITSCCGRLFSSGETAPASSIASLEPNRAMFLFFGFSGLMGLVGAGGLKLAARPLLGLYSLLSALFLVVGVAALLAFIAPYIYQMPTHHCPFDIFQAQYSYIGYPLTLSLAGAAIWGVLPTVIMPFSRRGTLLADYPALSRRWVARSLACLAFYAGFAAYQVWFRGLNLF